MAGLLQPMSADTLMRVLVLHSELGRLRGGGENFTRNLFTAFAARGHRVTAAFVADTHGRYPLPLPKGIEPMPIRGWWSRTLGQAMFSRIARLPLVNSRLTRPLDRVQEAVSWRVIRWHNRRFGRRLTRRLSASFPNFDSIYVHGDVELAAAVARVRPTILRLPGPVSADCREQLERVHAVCANGDALARIRAFIGSKAIELPVGLDQTLFRPGCDSRREALRWETRAMVIGYVGRLTHLKGVDILASAFRALSHQWSQVRLLIIGSGDAESALRLLLKEELGRGIARMIPDVAHDQLAGWYRAMDVFVMPSRYENWSNAVIEAMACGVPIVASDVGGNRSLADTGAAWLCQRDSVPSLTRCLAELAKNRDQLKVRGDIGSRYVRSRYDWSDSASQLEAVIASHLTPGAP